MLFFYKKHIELNRQLSSILKLVLGRAGFISTPIVLFSILSSHLIAQNPLSSAGKFNVFTQGNVTLVTNESEGPIAIGGNLTVNGNYQVAFTNVGDLQVSTIPIGLVVAGGVTLSAGQLQVNNKGYVKIGDCTGLKVWYKDNNDALSPIRITKSSDSYPSPSAWIQINTQADGWPGYSQPNQVSEINNPVCQTSPVNFSTAFTVLKANAASLTQCTGVSVVTENANGDVLGSIAGQNLYLDLPANPTADKPRIWNVSGADLNSINELNLRFTPTASQPLIINVSTGTSFTWNVKNQNVSGAMKYILWNFPTATTINIEGNATIEGSILAPNATITKTVNQSNIEGQLIAQSFTHSGGEMHHYPFEGNADCTTTVCVKPNAGKDTTICVASVQLNAPAQGEVWAFLSSSNANTPTVSTGGLASGLTVSGQYKFVLKKQSDANCSDTITVTRANFIIAKLSDQNICPGEILTFGYQGLSNVTYNWSTGATTPTITVSPMQTADYTVTVTSGSTGCVVKDTVTVTVDPKPNAGADTVSCTDTLKIKAAGQGETWSFLSFNDPNNANNTDVAAIDNQGNITGLDKNGFYRFILTNSNGCADTIRVQKTSVTIPVIQLNPICPGTTLSFGYNNTQDFNYSWSTGDMTAQISVKPDSTTDYYVTVTAKATGCSATDTVTVVVKPAPAITLVSSVCTQANTKYVTTVTVTNGATVTSNAGVVSGSGTSFTVTVGSDTTQYTLTATLDGCSTKLTVNKPNCSCPQINNPVAPGSSICGSGSATLLAIGCISGTTAKWYSNVGLTNEIDADSSFTTPSLSQNTDYYAACVSNSNTLCKSNGIKVTVTVNPLPTFSGINTNCAADNSVYSVTVISTGVVTIKSPATAQISGSGPYTISNVPAGQNLVLTSTLNGCSADSTITAPNCGCTPELPSALAANVGICAGDPIPTPTFTALVGANTAVDWYSASSGGTLLASNTLTFTAPAAGTYYLQAKSTAQGCNGQINPVRIPVTLTISPKPAFTAEAKDPTCQGGTALNDGGVRIVTGTVGNSYAFNTTGAGSLPTTASNANAINALPVIIAQNIPNNTPTLTYYIRVFSNEGCYKDTTVTVQPKTCVSDCPTITMADAADTLCSGYYGEPIIVTVSDTSKIVRFVYFTSPQTGSSMYSGGTLIEEVKPVGPIVGAPNGTPGLQLPANNGTVPVKYYVYAVLKTPPTSSPNCFPYAEKVYTVLPLPKFEMDSIPACTGDTSYTVNLSIATSGTFKVYVASGVASIGNGPIPTGVSQTLTNVPGGGQITALTLKTTGNSFIIVQDANGCATAGVAPAPSFKDCEGLYDLALDKSVSKKTAQVGEDITYTVKVWNEGQGTATNVSVKDTLSPGVEYVTYATATGNYNAVTKIWTIGSLAPGDTAILLLVVKVIKQGVWFNTAEICSMTEKDVDSTPCNGDDDEDDIDRECFSVPLEVCPGEAIQVAVPQGYTNVKWFKDGGTTEIATGNEILISDPGTYTFTASNNTCPAQGCCPIIIQPGNNCCPDNLCVPFVIKQTKKGGQLLK
ncbi:MAG: collagen-binding domain-containing protein [Spirosomataceae bacterium]